MEVWKERDAVAPSQDQIQELAEESARLEKMANLAEGKVEALQALVNAGDDDGTCCPV